MPVGTWHTPCNRASLLLSVICRSGHRAVPVDNPSSSRLHFAVCLLAAARARPFGRPACRSSWMMLGILLSEIEPPDPQTQLARSPTLAVDRCGRQVTRTTPIRLTQSSLPSARLEAENKARAWICAWLPRHRTRWPAACAPPSTVPANRRFPPSIAAMRSMPWSRCSSRTLPRSRGVGCYRVAAAAGDRSGWLAQGLTP